MPAAKSFTSVRFMVSDAGKMCFCVAVCAMLAAGIGAVVNHFLTGWMAVGGMAAIGLLYFAMGLTEVRREWCHVPAVEASHDESATLTSSPAERVVELPQPEMSAARGRSAPQDKRKAAGVASDA
jgi:hypothetical protein